MHLITGLELGGGAENMLLQLLPRMQNKLDNGICVIKGRGEIGKKLEERGIKVYYLDLKNIFDLGIIFRYRKLLKDFSPDVQVNYLIHADIFGRIFGKIFGVKKIVPYIRNIHRGKPFLMFLDKLTLPLADFILTNSETAKKYYIEKMRAKKDKIKCIPNAVDISRFENIVVNRNEKLKELEIDEKKFIIGCVARLEKQKDIPILIKAFSEVNKKNPETHLLIIGHGKEKENIEKMTADLNLKGKITMLEKRTDMPELYQIMDIFVLPSLNEGMSNALLEAMASKKLIITSNIEENTELIKEGFSGLIFISGDEKNLAEKINFLFSNNISGKFNKNAFETVQKKYRIEKVCNDYFNFLSNF